MNEKTKQALKDLATAVQNLAVVTVHLMVKKMPVRFVKLPTN